MEDDEDDDDDDDDEDDEDDGGGGGVGRAAGRALAGIPGKDVHTPLTLHTVHTQTEEMMQ